MDIEPSKESVFALDFKILCMYGVYDILFFGICIRLDNDNTSQIIEPTEIAYFKTKD